MTNNQTIKLLNKQKSTIKKEEIILYIDDVN